MSKKRQPKRMAVNQLQKPNDSGRLARIGQKTAHEKPFALTTFCYESVEAAEAVTRITAPISNSASRLVGCAR